MTLIRFDYKLPYGDTRRPVLVAHLRRNGQPKRVTFHVDSGAEWTLVNGDLLAPLGFEPPPVAVLKAAKTRDRLEDHHALAFNTAIGESVIGVRFDVLLSIDNGPSDIDIGVYGIVVEEEEKQLKRNLLGRDFFRKVQIVGFDDYNSNIYLSGTIEGGPFGPP